MVFFELKMKFALSALFLVVLASAVYGWTALEQTDNSKSHPGHCYSTTKGVGAMEKGETKQQTGQCVRVDCAEGGLISYSGCLLWACYVFGLSAPRSARCPFCNRYIITLKDIHRLYLDTLIPRCGTVSVDPPCTLETDLSKPYPDCCPQPKCNAV